ncbi:related to onanonoxo-7-onima-8-eninoihtemlysoneda [Phialocephala subalpina]|uniref:Related to onanonoxo-7-onima-8-eninoihtemlysoneda n=1 Tax=Phialocephala subalpina TaxID=576137 RepID=A0A1L7X8Y7_9HELO|nr:related to onanonoxo-7-onima-8-eninoihtemlysoneda [Phialocephala subalpina]
MPSRMSSLWRSLPAYQIYGANTNVGKTIMSTILLKAHARKYPSQNTWYLKPVSTGPLEEADDRHISYFAPKTQTRCLYQFDEAVSPHIAARSSKPLSDISIQEQVLAHLSSCATTEAGLLLLETAGGVHSPTPSGSSQADLFRPLRLPVCLVADHHLGGISATISAFESLHIRGYDLEVVCQFKDSMYQNHEYLSSYFEKKGILSLSLPPPPEKAETIEEDREVMAEYYEKMSALEQVEETLDHLIHKNSSRIQYLEEMSEKAHKTIWYPFTQHRDISPSTIMAIDSAHGDFFQTYSTPLPDPPSTSNPSNPSNTSSPTSEPKDENFLTPTFDGSASWWTQGLGHASSSLTLASAYASGRYGHVMFAGTIHEPALSLAEDLLRTVNNPRLTRCFYSDNGSTGMEVAIKMALSAASTRYGWATDGKEMGIIGLKGSYHGDTIGAMDASEPSTFNERVHWYKGRGHWFDFPQVKLKKGEWVVESPEVMEEEFGKTTKFESLGDIFDIQARLKSRSARLYKSHIEDTLDRLVRKEGRKFGALVMEPVILGAGGMLFADPLFQHLLASTIRSSSHLFTPSDEPSTDSENIWQSLPIIHDEVFTGLYRLGRSSSSSFIKTHPDISVHAKLLTGGLVPLCATLASESIYEAFLGNEKADALLHGHSYTAHAVGCQVAGESLRELNALDSGGEWNSFKTDWNSPSPSTSTSTGQNDPVWSVWSKSFVETLSMSEEVESVIALGSVLAINLQDEHAGYSSTAATGLQKKLLKGGERFKIHNRVLGNVLYLMASQTSRPETLKSIERLLMECLS